MADETTDRAFDGMTDDEIKLAAAADSETTDVTDENPGEEDNTAAGEEKVDDAGIPASEEKEPENTAKPSEPEQEPKAEDEPAKENTTNPDENPGEEEKRTAREYQTPEQVIEDTDNQIHALDQSLKDLAEKFDNGDLSAVEYTQQQMLLNDQRTQLLIDQRMSQRSAQERLEKWAYETVPEFLKSHQQYADVNSAQYQLLDAEVKRLQEQAIARGENTLTKEILEQAHTNLTNAARLLTGQPDATAQQNVIVAKQNNTIKANQERPMPPNLSHAPSAEISDVSDGGKTGYLDRLAETDTVAFEKELEKLSQEERERYLSR